MSASNATGWQYIKPVAEEWRLGRAHIRRHHVWALPEGSCYLCFYDDMLFGRADTIGEAKELCDQQIATRAKWSTEEFAARARAHYAAKEEANANSYLGEAIEGRICGQDQQKPEEI